MCSSGCSLGNRITIISLMTKEIYLTHRWFLAGLLLVFLSGCASQTTGESLIAAWKIDVVRPVVIDVRTRGEFVNGHIPGAVNISVFTLPFNMDRIPVSSRDQKVVVYCAHGPRAGLAGFFLSLSGFTDVYHLKDDFTGWRKGGYPIKDIVGEN